MGRNKGWFPVSFCFSLFSFQAFLVNGPLTVLSLRKNSVSLSQTRHSTCSNGNGWMKVWLCECVYAGVYVWVCLSWGGWRCIICLSRKISDFLTVTVWCGTMCRDSFKASPFGGNWQLMIASVYSIEWKILNHLLWIRYCNNEFVLWSWTYFFKSWSLFQI